MQIKIFLLLIIINTNVWSKNYLVKNLSLPLYNIEKKKIAKEESTFDFNTQEISIVNFWAEWCTSCAQEVPLLNELKEDLTTKNPGLKFNFIAINAGDKVRRIKRFLRKHPFNYKHYVDKKKTYSKSINVDALPVTLVIQNNKILFHGHKPPTKQQVQKLIQKANDKKTDQNKDKKI